MLTCTGSSFRDEEEEDSIDDDDMPAEPERTSDSEGMLALQAEHTADRPSVIRPGIVHRIDKGTSGMLMICINSSGGANVL